MNVEFAKTVAARRAGNETAAGVVSMFEPDVPNTRAAQRHWSFAMVALLGVCLLAAPAARAQLEHLDCQRMKQYAECQIALDVPMPALQPRSVSLDFTAGNLQGVAAGVSLDLLLLANGKLLSRRATRWRWQGQRLQLMNEGPVLAWLASLPGATDLRVQLAGLRWQPRAGSSTVVMEVLLDGLLVGGIAQSWYELDPDSPTAAVASARQSRTALAQSCVGARCEASP